MAAPAIPPSAYATDPVARVGAPYIAAFGDSIANANFDTSTATSAFSSKGPITQVVAMLKGRVRLDPSLNFGVDATDSTNFLTRLPQVVASAASIVVVQGPTNDFTNQITPHTTTIANMNAIYSALIKAGKIIIAQPIMPRGLWYSLSASDQAIAQKLIQRFNSWLRGQAYAYPATKFFVADADVQTIDRSQATFIQIGSVFRDGLHPNGYGGELIAGAGGGGLFSILDRILPPRPSQIVSPADLYDATNNPLGALNPNPRMTGSVAASGAGVSGNIPSNMLVARDQGTVLTAAAAMVQDSGINNGTSLQLTLGATGTEATINRLAAYQTLSPSPAGYQPGDQLYVEAEVDQSGLANVLNIEVQALDQSSSGTRVYGGCVYSGSGSDNEYPTLSRVIRTPVFTVASDTTGMQMRVHIRTKANTTPSGVVTIRELAVRKAITPTSQV